MAGYWAHDDPGDLALSMENLHLQRRLKRTSVKKPPCLSENTETVTVKVGGNTTGNVLRMVKLYIWTKKMQYKSITASDICSKSDTYSVCVNEDKLIISGGWDDRYNVDYPVLLDWRESIADVHQFCFTSMKWQELNPMPRPRESHNSACINQLMIIFAGCLQDSWGSTKLKEEYYKEVYALNLRTGAWTAKKECPIRVELASIAVVNGDLYLIGGGYTVDLFMMMSKKTCKFSLPNNEWTACADIPASKEYAVNSTVALGHNIYVLVFKDFFVYNTQRNQWSALSAPILPSKWCSLVHKDNTLVMMGGYEDTKENPHKRIQCYNLRTKEWSLISDTLPLPLAYHTVVVMELPMA